MPDLSAIDVHRMLRQHADLGHDVLTDPRTAHLGEPNDPLGKTKPFGMAISHHLIVPEEGSPELSGLGSYLAHGEKPSITSLYSGADMDKGSLFSRSAYLLNPYTLFNTRGTKSHLYNEAFGLSHLDYRWKQHNILSGNEHENTPGSIHEALKKHMNAPVTYETQNALTGERSVQPENIHGWNPQEANKFHSGLHEPFSNKIHVVHYTGNYSYDPDTEQLLKDL